MNESMNVFGQLANMPNIAKNYLFRIRFWSYKDEKYDHELMLRAKRILMNLILPLMNLKISMSPSCSTDKRSH